MVRRRGFTLIELLVVIAIIGILAAMLFPVFAKARESARKAQCLSNVKNIAMAIQMYLADYDKFPPGNTDPIAIAAVNAASPKGLCSTSIYNSQGYRSNPYLRWPVTLDDYIKNREIWKCPSAKFAGYPTWIQNVPATGNWYQYLEDNSGAWGGGAFACRISTTGDWTVGNGNCVSAWPQGWGGSTTDSIAQNQLCDEHADDAFEISIGVSTYMYGTKTASLTDATKFVVCADNTLGGEELMLPAMTAYGRGGVPTDPEARKNRPPHFAGINVGFADGHAKWWSADAFVGAGGGCDANGDWFAGPKDGLKGQCPDFAL